MSLFCLLLSVGPLAEVHLSIDTVTKKIRGYAFILFMMPEHAVRAYEELDGTIFKAKYHTHSQIWS